MIRLVLFHKFAETVGAFVTFKDESLPGCGSLRFCMFSGLILGCEFFA